MSVVSEYAAAVTVVFNRISAGITGVKEDVDSLKAKIEELIASGGVSAADKALLDEALATATSIADRITALDNETVPAPPA